jgi:iron-regulated transporter 1
MIAYFKAHDFDDAFLAGMRALNVVAGLAGTLAMPLLERAVGLVRTGSWSIWSQVRRSCSLAMSQRGSAAQVACLIPVVLSFFLAIPAEGDRGPAWHNALIFGGARGPLSRSCRCPGPCSGMILSRVGLWSFDLVQTKELQLSLADHPDRNSLCVASLLLGRS